MFDSSKREQAASLPCRSVVRSGFVVLLELFDGDFANLFKRIEHTDDEYFLDEVRPVEAL